MQRDVGTNWVGAGIRANLMHRRSFDNLLEPPPVLQELMSILLITHV
jgi:hypothetical protein